MFVILELVNKEKDKNNEMEAQNLMLVAIEEKNIKENKLCGRYNVSYLIH